MSFLILHYPLRNRTDDQLTTQQCCVHYFQHLGSYYGNRAL